MARPIMRAFGNSVLQNLRKLEAEIAADKTPKNFGSDTSTRLSSEVIAAMVKANYSGDCAAHGHDETSRRAITAVKDIAGFSASQASQVHVALFGSTTACNKALFDAFTSFDPKKTETNPGRVLVCNRSHVLRFEIQPRALSTGSDDKITSETVEKFLASGTALRAVWLDQPINDLFYQPEEVVRLAEFTKKHGLALGADLERSGSHLARRGMKYSDFFDAGLNAGSLGFGKSGGPLSSATIVTSLPQVAQKDVPEFIERIRLSHGSGLHTHGFIGASGWEEYRNLWRDNFRKSNEYADKIFATLKKFKFDGKPVEFCSDPLTSNMIFAKLPKDFVAMMPAEHGLSVDSRDYARIIASNIYSPEDVEIFVQNLCHTKELYDQRAHPSAQVSTPQIEREEIEKNRI